jgi:hypothetical protein
LGGRSLALATLDKMLARSCNQAALQRALEKNFRTDPVKFFRTMIMPLMPKETKLNLEHDGVLEWKSLLGPCREVIAAAGTEVRGQKSEISDVSQGGDSGGHTGEK